jgi:DNA-binding transcriptional LysR family regulator
MAYHFTPPPPSASRRLHRPCLPVIDDRIPTGPESALSRQISDLEQELRVGLFDRVGRRLVLTAIGEELLGDCRSVLGQVGALGERAELLRRGDSGVLRVAASPQMIESVLSTFLPRYAGRFPNVQVELTEALGPAQVALLERGEVHLGIRHDQELIPVSRASHYSRTRCWPRALHRSTLDPRRRLISAALPPTRCYCWSQVTRCAYNSMRLAVWQTSNPTCCLKAARPTPCLLSPKLDTAWQSFRRCCARIAMS